MMRALYSGVSGLKTHQTKMDVIGNNIANVNTTAYKSKSINFSDLLYQTTQSAKAPDPSTNTAGTNARQIGLGAKTAAISTSITTEGANQTTGNPFDVKITGEAFFVVSDGSHTYFTRDGSFTVDAAGYLAMSGTGYNVMGWTNVAADGTVTQDSVKAIKVMDAASQTYPAEATKQAYISGIIDSNDTQLGTTSGKPIAIQIYDNKGYTYNLKFGMKPVTAQITSSKNTTHTERSYDLPASVAKIDNSKVTYTLADGTVLTATNVPDTLLEAIKTSADTARGTTTGAGTQTVTLDDTFLGGVGLSTSNFAQYSQLKDKVVTVTYDGTTGVMAYDSNGKELGILDVDTKTLDKIYGGIDAQTAAPKSTPVKIALPTTSTPLTVDEKKYSDGTDTQYDVYLAGTINTTISYGDISSLLAMDGSPTVVSQYVTTENTTSEDVIDGQFTLSLLSMTDSEGNEVDIKALNNPSTTVVYSTNNGDFSYVGSQGNNTFQLNLGTLGGNFENLTIDMSTSNNVDNKGTSTISGTAGDLDGNSAGRRIGTITGLTISPDGKIYATYSNSQTKVLAQISMATFANANGLANVGSNCYEETQNSGSFDGIGKTITAASGSLTTGCLEMSNVDLSNEFTEMITTQRGFQANSRIITVSDTILEELVNLKR